MHLLFAVLLLAHWLVASDLHVDPRLHGGPLVADGKDTSWALFDSSVAAMRKAEPNPAVVILPGDFLAHHFPRNTALALATMARIVRTFDAAFPRAQFIIVPGNNDDPCGDYRVTPGTPYFTRIAHLWAPLVNRNGAAPNFERDFARYGWYTARLPDGLRAIAMDTVYWSIVYRSCRNSTGDAQRELRWLADSLSTLPPKDRAAVIMHIPPGVDASSTKFTHGLLIVPFWQEQYATAFVRQLHEDSSRIAFAIAGHVHRDSFRLFGGVPILVAPPISPVYENNPSFLLLDVSARGTLRDFVPFEYESFSEQWQRQASFDTAYGVSNFSATSLASIHDRLRGDRDLRRRWVDMYVTGADEDETMWQAWRTYWCAQTELPGGFVACAGLQRRVALVPIAVGVVGAAVLALLVFLAVRLRRQRRRA
jgi:sphingomyelin phosphodiesterase acid-like 3